MPGYNSDATEENMASVKVIQATSTLIELKLQFSDMMAVSSDQQTPDQIRISLDEEIFSDPSTGLKINEGLPFSVELPRQLEEAEQ